MTRRSRASLDRLAKKTDDAHSPEFDAAVYFQTRNMNPARSSTLTKAMRARRIENGKRPLSFADEILTKREMRRVEKGQGEFPADHTLRHQGGALAFAEMLYWRF